MSDTEQTYGYNHEIDEDDPEEDECEICGLHVDDCICDPDEDDE